MSTESAGETHCLTVSLPLSRLLNGLCSTQIIVARAAAPKNPFQFEAVGNATHSNVTLSWPSGTKVGGGGHRGRSEQDGQCR